MMNTKKRLTHALLAAALGLGLTTGLKAADAEGRARVGGFEGRAQVDVQDRDRWETQQRWDRQDRQIPGYGYAITDERQTRQREMRTGLPDHKQAGNVIGMNVRNQAGENLGRITDLAIDLERGQIGYAVLGVGGFLGIGERLIAVPTHALQYDHTADALILNVTRDQLEQAPSFARGNWPQMDGTTAMGRNVFLDVRGPRFDARYDQQFRQDRFDRDGVGARIDAEVGTGAGRFDQRYDQRYDQRFDQRYDQQRYDQRFDQQRQGYQDRFGQQDRFGGQTQWDRR